MSLVARQAALGGADLAAEDIAELLTTVGGRIRFMRLAAGFSQVALAAKVHVTQPAISQYEKNRWLPNPDVQVDIAEALGTTRDFLFSRGPAVVGQAVA